MSLKGSLASSRAARRFAVTMAAAVVAVGGFTLTSAGGQTEQSSRCTAIQQVYLETTDPAARAAIADYLRASGCTVPDNGTSTTSSSTSTSTSTSTSSTSTSTSSTSTTLAVPQTYCGGLAAALSVVTDPLTRAAIQSLQAAAGCIGTA